MQNSIQDMVVNAILLGNSKLLDLRLETQNQRKFKHRNAKIISALRLETLKISALYG